MKKTDIKIVRYVVDGYSDHFYVDVVELEDQYEAWLGHVQYGYSDFMFGILKKYGDLNYALHLIEANVDDYIASYQEKYYD